MTPLQLRERFRRDVDDIKPTGSDESDLLFTDDEINDYINEAHRRFVAETLYYHTILELNVVATESDIELPDTFLDMRGKQAKLVTANATIPRVEFNEDIPQDDYGISVASAVIQDSSEGQPRRFSLDIEFNTLRLFPTPAEDDTLQIPAYVEPDDIDFATEDELDTAFVITNRHHVLRLLPGMKELAYSKQDADSYDPRQAEKWGAVFADTIADTRSERMRRRRRPTEIMYGGI